MKFCLEKLAGIWSNSQLYREVLAQCACLLWRYGVGEGEEKWKGNRGSHVLLDSGRVVSKQPFARKVITAAAGQPAGTGEQLVK